MGYEYFRLLTDDILWKDVIRVRDGVTIAIVSHSRRRTYATYINPAIQIKLSLGTLGTFGTLVSSKIPTVPNHRRTKPPKKHTKTAVWQWFTVKSLCYGSETNM